MAEELKKISFGFSKAKKQSNLVKPIEISQPEIEYVDSFDGVKGKFSYKGNIRSDEPVKKELVIPLVGTKTVLEVIRAKLDENNAKTANDQNNRNQSVQEEGNEKLVEKTQQNESVIENLSIDELAAKEIVNDLQKKTTIEETKNSMVIKQPITASEEKDDPIDYENIPVNDFGLAMLRGMGWTPQTGIGKDQRVVAVIAPKLRPKGLGLGADKVMQKAAPKEADLSIAIKGYVRFITGTHEGCYGQIEALDDDSGRVIVKLTLGGTVSASEMVLTPVTRKEYEKNSKVINTAKYEKFKEPESNRRTKAKVESPERTKDNRHRKEKYDRQRRSADRLTSESPSSEEKRERRRKKRHKRGDSTERKRKKLKKKSKKKSRYSSNSDSSVDYRPSHRKRKSSNCSHSRDHDHC